MKRYVSCAALAISCLLSATAGHSQQGSTWIDKEFSNPEAVQTQAVESFLNETCQPSSLDGIQLLGVQNGHNSTLNLHVYCRQDKKASAQYKVTLTPIFNRQVDPTVAPLAHQPGKLVGPFYFGKTGENDAFVLVEKLK